MPWRRETTDRLVLLVRGVIAASVVTCLAIGWWRAAVPPGTSPVKHFSDTKPPLPTARCADCHQEQVQSLSSAPHALTLQSGTSELIQKTFGNLKYQDPDPSPVTDVFQVTDHRLWRRNSSFPDPLPVDWVMGSGRHARTPVTVRETAHGTTELLEHRVSWYPHVGLDLTLGANGETTTAVVRNGLGKWLNPIDTADCFGCHSTWLPSTNGHLDLQRMVPGVQCARCHWHGDEHLQAVAAGDSDPHIERWSDLSPLESIRRCGECHRRDDHLTHFELRAENQALVRFAPVGLSQSRCFKLQDQVTASGDGRPQRLDCLTCHDPHRPAETRPEYYVERCVKCHGSQAGQATGCSATNTSQKCLDCHMPKVEVQQHLRFTDHWIRKR